MKKRSKFLSVFVTLAMLVSMAVMPVSVRAANYDEYWGYANAWPLSGATTVRFNKNWYDSNASTLYINSENDLAALIYYVNSSYGDGDSFSGKKIILNSDLDMEQYYWRSAGSSTYNPFKGEFDGNNHTIKGIRSAGDASFKGLFGFTNSAKIYDLSVELSSDGAVTTARSVGVGGIIGNATLTELTNCRYSGSITTTQAYYVGGIVGSAENCTITKCASFGNIIDNGSASNGGIAGKASKNTKIDNSSFNGKISLTKSSNNYDAGGIVSWAADTSTVSNCFVDDGFSITANSTSANIGGIIGLDESTGEVYNCAVASSSSINGGSGAAGGIIGLSKASNKKITKCVSGALVSSTGNSGGILGAAGTSSSSSNTATVTDCYNSGNVNGLTHAGGIIGLLPYGTINHCINTGSVNKTSNNSTNAFVGGIVGSNINGTILNCSNTGSVSGYVNNSDFVGGIAGGNGYEGSSTGIAYVKNSYNTGTITGQGRTGGLVGANGYTTNSNTNHTITNSYNRGAASGSSTSGAITGYLFHGIVNNTYWYNGDENTVPVYFHNEAWQGSASGNGYFTSKDTPVQLVTINQSSTGLDGTPCDKTVLERLQEEKANNADYLNWTSTDVRNDGYPVFSYPITVKYKIEGESDTYAADTNNIVSLANLTDKDITSAAAGDTVRGSFKEVGTTKYTVKTIDKVESYSPVLADTQYEDVDVTSNSFTMPPFKAAVYVTLTKEELDQDDWISALIYGYEPTTIDDKKYDKVTLVTGTDEQNVVFGLVIEGDVTYIGGDFGYTDSVTAETYYDGTDYTDTLKSVTLNASDLGKQHLFTASFNIPSDSFNARITFQPKTSDGSKTGNKYSWKNGDKFLTPVSE